MFLAFNLQHLLRDTFTQLPACEGVTNARSATAAEDKQTKKKGSNRSTETHTEESHFPSREY